MFRIPHSSTAYGRWLSLVSYSRLPSMREHETSSTYLRKQLLVRFARIILGNSQPSPYRGISTTVSFLNSVGEPGGVWENW